MTLTILTWLVAPQLLVAAACSVVAQAVWRSTYSRCGDAARRVADAAFWSVIGDEWSRHLAQRKIGQTN